MAFITGALAGGGFAGNLILGVLGIGVKLALAYFFPQKVQGPRAESLKAQTSRYGDHLGRLYGTYRSAGAVIWLKADHVDEHVRTERQGKALGPEVTSYSYTATFAVAFAWNGPFTAIPRIWADDKLIYDNSADSDLTGVAEGASVTIYLGTDAQTADPDIEADRGAGQVPAMPGIAYVVIKDLPLDEFGIRVPNIEAELVRTGELDYSGHDLPDIPEDTPSRDGLDIYGDTVAYSNEDHDQLTIENVASGTARATIGVTYEIRTVNISAARNEVIVTDDDGDMHVYDISTGALKAVVSGPGASPFFLGNIDEITIAGTTWMLFFYDFRVACYANSGSGWSFQWSQSQGFGVLLGNTISVGPDYIYTIFANRFFMFPWSATGIGGHTEPTIAGLTGLYNRVHYDADSDSVIITTSDAEIFVISSDASTVLRSTISDWSGDAQADGVGSKRLKSGSNTIAFVENNNVYEFRVSDLTLIGKYATSLWGFNFGTGSDRGGVSQSARALAVFSLSNDAGVILLPRIARGGEPLADVLDAECRSVGLAPDVSLITTDIWGYGDRSGSSPRGVIEDLLRVNFVDFAQIDGRITFFPRKTSAVRTLTVAQTGMALNGTPNPVQVIEEYPAALDMPEQVIIQYVSYDAIYRMGSQDSNADGVDPFPDEPTEADETGSPVKIRRSRRLEFTTAQVLKDHDAAKVCDILHRDMKDAATVYKTPVGPRHLDLYPGLVLNLPLDDVRTAKAVLTKMSGETLIDLEFRKRGDTYTSDAVGAPTPYVVDSLLGIATATPVLIDGHLMRASDDNDGFYAGIAITSSGQFRSGTLFQSEDGGSSYVPWAAFTNGMIRGIAVNALPDRPHPDAFDRASSLIIAVPQGTAPDSVTEEALLGSEVSNGFAVWNASLGEWEYIRAASVVDNLDGTWTLETLLRGRKGTEFAMAGHAIGDTVYHLDQDAFDRATDGDRTLSRIYVAVPSSTRFNSAGAVTFTNYGKGLRPWSPAFDSATLDSGSGDWTFTWHRRDRLGQAWPEDGSEDPPLSEDAEEYTVNIYDGTGMLVNSYTASMESYVYTAADQTTDFGSPQSSIEFGIAQVSAIYGDGVEMREAA